LIGDTQLVLSRRSRLLWDASGVARNLFLLAEVYHRSGDPRVLELRERFHERFGDMEGEMLPNQVRYASRLANAPGDLTTRICSSCFPCLRKHTRSARWATAWTSRCCGRWKLPCGLASRLSVSSRDLPPKISSRNGAAHSGSTRRISRSRDL